MGAWRYSTNGQEMSRPRREGIYINGPLSVEDLKEIIGDLIDEIADMVKEEAEKSK